jgi:hypothetical protein
VRLATFFAAVALVASGCSSAGSQSVEWCDTAVTWRDAVQAFEEATNRADRSTIAGRMEMHDAFATLANVTLPVVAPGALGDALLGSMVRFTDTAEAWLSAGSIFYAQVSGDPVRVAYEVYEEQRLELNAAFRNANSHLVDACDVKPIVLYTTEGAVHPRDPRPHA